MTLISKTKTPMLFFSDFLQEMKIYMGNTKRWEIKEHGFFVQFKNWVQ